MFPASRRHFLQQAAFSIALTPNLSSLIIQSASPLPQRKSAATLESTIPQLMSEKKVPGLTIAIARDSRVVWQRSFGVKNLQAGEAVTDDTVFEAASLSKPVFAYAVMKLVEAGKFELDTPLVSYLKGKPLDPNPQFDTSALQSDSVLQKVTARHVLSHTSGLLNWDRSLKVHFAPGEKFSYSGQGYVLLQSIVERITGQPLEELTRASVFKPLGMDNSSFICEQTCKRLKSAGHFASGQVVTRELNSANSASSLHTTASDYASFLLAMMNATGLKRESVRRMLTPQIKVDEGCVNCAERSTNRLSESLSWGLGWGLQRSSGAATDYWHWGNNAGIFNAYTQVSPQQGSGLVVLTNSGNGLSLMPAIVLEVFGQPSPALEWIKNR